MVEREVVVLVMGVRFSQSAFNGDKNENTIYL